MVSREITIINKLGLHARPAAQLVKTASKFAAEISLRKEALIRATHASTAIEGNPLSLEEVTKLAQGRKVTATRRAKQEVLNYLNVLENIEKYQEAGKIKETHILKLHRDITKETLENPEWEGKYRGYSGVCRK